MVFHDYKTTESIKRALISVRLSYFPSLSLDVAEAASTRPGPERASRVLYMKVSDIPEFLFDP